MGNAKSKSNPAKIEEGISRDLTETIEKVRKTITPVAGRSVYTRKEDNLTITTGTTARGLFLVEVENNTPTTTENLNKAEKDAQQIELKQQRYQHNQRQQKAADNSVLCAVTEQQHSKQTFSVCSLGSLNCNFSYSDSKSYTQRQKLSRKSFSTLQYRRKRSKTQWHKPLTNAIFSSHFKEPSRNEEFHIDQLVAKGAFGVVFKVIDKKLLKEHQQQKDQQQQQEEKQQAFTTAYTTSCPTVYALKVLKKSKIIAESSLQQIKDEVDIQKLCGHHPFIVKQIDLWQNRHNLHILSEYVPNGELFSTIRSFSLNLIRLYLAEIALALDFLHNAGIIYRDVKPENILLTSNYHLKLTDFGLSKWLKFGLTTKTMCGTFQYMAPEILKGESYTHAVDWWSLGIIVCQMFVKKSPDIKQFINIKLPEHLQGKDSVDKAKNLKFLESSESLTGATKLLDTADFLPQEVQKLPSEARDVLKRLLEFDSQKRIHSVRALQRIAMYKDFKIESQYCLKIHPLDIFEADNISIITKTDMEKNFKNANKAFKDF